MALDLFEAFTTRDGIDYFNQKCDGSLCLLKYTVYHSKQLCIKEPLKKDVRKCSNHEVKEF